MTKTWILAALLAGGASTAAMAQEATGDWIGKVTTPGAELTITMHMQTGANGVLEGYAGSPDQTPARLPMSDIVMKDGALSFAVPMVGATYTGRWDAAAKTWVGTLRQNGFDMPLALTHGQPTPRPVVAGLDGVWTGLLATPQGDLRLVLKVKTDAAGTLALFSSPDQNPAEVVAVLAHDGDAVSVQLKGIGGFDGKLSADGKTLDGDWRQGGGSLQLTMKR